MLSAKAKAEIRVFNWHLEVCLAREPFLSRTHLFMTGIPFPNEMIFSNE